MLRVDGRQVLLYRIMEGLPVIRPEEQIARGRVSAKILEGTRVPLVPSGLLSNELVIYAALV